LRIASFSIQHSAFSGDVFFFPVLLLKHLFSFDLVLLLEERKTWAKRLFNQKKSDLQNKTRREALRSYSQISTNQISKNQNSPN